jgi:hypothetical protein
MSKVGVWDFWRGCNGLGIKSFLECLRLKSLQKKSVGFCRYSQVSVIYQSLFLFLLLFFFFAGFGKVLVMNKPLCYHCRTSGRRMWTWRPGYHRSCKRRYLNCIVSFFPLNSSFVKPNWKRQKGLQHGVAKPIPCVLDLLYVCKLSYRKGKT